MRKYIDSNVYDEAIRRLEKIYKEGHRVVVSFSAGKDSGVCLELCIIAAKITNRLPVDVIMRDDEIMVPGTFEYAERVARRPEVKFHWIYANQPVINIYNRKLPYYWVFDPLLSPDKWVRKPPSFAYKINDLSITKMVTEDRFPIVKGKKLISVTGLRSSESRIRKMATSKVGFLTGKQKSGVYIARPIYDWHIGDVWKAIKDNKWDYNEFYDVMAAYGIHGEKIRVMPPFMIASKTNIDLLQKCSQAYPKWFFKVCERLDGIKNGVYYGLKAITPKRHLHESWQECFYRTCIEDAPDWISQRGEKVKDIILKTHPHHSSTKFSQSTTCSRCGTIGSWKSLTMKLYMGDPFLSLLGTQFINKIGYIEPEFFRKGGRNWHGKPTF